MIVIAVIIAMVLTHIVMLVLGAVFVGVAWMVLKVSELIYWRRVKKRNKQGGRKE